MRIEAYNQVAQLYKTNKASGARPTSKAGMGRDEVQISSFGRDYQVAKKAVAEASDIREDKVAEMKTKLESNNYQVDTGDFASKLLEKYNMGL
ncbi:MAG: flagellar biosynthesis anti-sigma factor FlgM [Pararoseburia sp.]|nr:flagellar biosynthesis anti-sigma factor FlgM [Lachnospiraceae bacterium]MDY4792636.1 flagellar biosynthesis anti-sigma factor FlgM [Pararoseburia sp.]